MCNEEQLYLQHEDGQSNRSTDAEAALTPDPRDEIIVRLEQAWLRDVATLDDLPAAA